MSVSRPVQQAPRRHVIPGLVLFTAFIGISLAGHARQVARQPPPPAFGEGGEPADPFAADDAWPADPQEGGGDDTGDDGLEVVGEAGVLEEREEPPARAAPTPPPQVAEAPVAAPADQADPSTQVLASLQEAFETLDAAGRDPANVMLAVERARAKLDEADRALKTLRAAAATGVDEAGRAHGRLVRASTGLDAAARKTISGAHAAMNDPFSEPERLVEEAGARVAAARLAMDPAR